MVPFGIENIHRSPSLQVGNMEPRRLPGPPDLDLPSTSKETETAAASAAGTSTGTASAEPWSKASSTGVETILNVPPKDLPPSWLPQYNSGDQRSGSFVLHDFDTRKEMNKPKFTSWLRMQLVAVHPDVLAHNTSASVMTAKQLSAFIYMSNHFQRLTAKAQPRAEGLGSLARPSRSQHDIIGCCSRNTNMDLAPCAFGVWNTAAAMHSARRALSPNSDELRRSVDNAWQDLHAVVLAAYRVLRVGPAVSLQTLAFSADVLSTLLHTPEDQLQVGDERILDVEECIRRADLEAAVSLGRNLPFDVKATMAWGSLKDATSRLLLLALPRCLTLLRYICEKTQNPTVLDFCYDLSVLLDDLLLLVQGLFQRQKMVGRTSSPIANE
ncbi:unnamed protein product [Symbiodinium sp. CCMP2592]|nr:unnamed protein product [Symbiodinium sp. CCMP2592]